MGCSQCWIAIPGDLIEVHPIAERYNAKYDYINQNRDLIDPQEFRTYKTQTLGAS